MIQQQLAFDAADDAPTARDIRGHSGVRGRRELIDLLDEVTRRVRQTTERGPAAETASPEAASVTTMRHTVRNAQMIAARARRAIEALPGTDLELLRALQRLVVATREAHETRRADEFARGTHISVPPGERP